MIGAYCAVCGQARDTHRRSVWGLIKVLVEDIVSFDSRILRTGWALVFKPGELASAFREGRTQRYVPALRLYLFVSLIFFLILSVDQHRADAACRRRDADKDHLDARGRPMSPIPPTTRTTATRSSCPR